MISTEFLLTSLVVVLVPGTGVIYTVSTGLFMGRRASIAAAIGVTPGIVPHLLASIFGLAAILHMSSLAFQVVNFQVVRYAAAAYLLYLAWSMWSEAGVLKLETPGKRNGIWQIISRGFLINILNPKLFIFFLAFLPQFFPTDTASPLPQMLLLSSLFMGMTLCVFMVYGTFAHGVRTSVVNSPKIILGFQRTFAVVFAALGTKLALADQ